MPQLGETVTEGTITKWLKNVGDKVVMDEVLFEVSTDKVDSEVPSTATGYVSAILAHEGDTVAVGTVLAKVSDSLDSVSIAPENPGQASPAIVPESIPQPTQPQSRVSRENVAEAEQQYVSAAAAYSSSKPLNGGSNSSYEGLVLSPVVRRLLSENSLDPKDIQGTGAGGRISRSDVLSFLDQRAMQGDASFASSQVYGQPTVEKTLASRELGEAPVATSAETSVSIPPTVERTTVLQRNMRAEPYSPVSASEGDEVIPFNNIRRRTAEHMVRSKATSAHTLVAIEVDFEQVDRVRKAVKEVFAREEGFSLTYLPFVSRAVVEAVRTFPRINSSVGDDELIVHRELNLAIAVDLDQDGLIAPVIHGADQMRLKGFARKIRDLATRARTKRLSADELAGGTFTITNPGPYGTFLTVPIINQPQVAILSTDGVKRKPVVVTLPDGSESIAIHSVGMFALSFDHRVIDGAYAAAFLARMKEIVETWNWAQEF